MIIGISSSQGQGKSTIISSLHERGYNVIQSHTSRKILDEWGISLPEIESNTKLRVKFQEEVFLRHYELIRKYNERNGVYIIERTFLDIFSYTLISLGLYNEFSSWLDEYYHKCKNAQSLFSLTFVLNGLNIQDPEKNDGVRSINQHFSKLVHGAIVQSAESMIDDEKKIIEIYSPDHEERLENITKGIDLICKK